VLLAVVMILLFSVRLAQEGINPPSAPPPREPKRARSADQEVVLEYSADRKISVNKQEVSQAELGARLREIYRARTDKTMWLLGAGTLRYGEIADVIDTAKAAGVERVGVITPEMRKRQEMGKR
jgi:biopolymer transport protein ExbD/biopolymer transport protein TolR